MPFRVNGIGTTYIGQQNGESHVGVCESCGQACQLSDYDTRLWFTFIFIPVIPLARKRILGDCSNCRRHRIVSAKEWQEFKDSAIRDAMTELESDTKDVDKAVQMHATLAGCGEREQADAMAEVMQQDHANNADAQMYLASWYEQTGRATQADACFHRALQADPDHLGAQRAVAIGLLQAGKPHEAEEKLAAFRPPSVHFEPQLFFMLATAYQNAGEHEKAAELLRMLHERDPQLAKDKTFRKAAKKSETSLADPESILPKQSIYRSRPFLWSAAAACVLAALGLTNLYFAHHRSAYLLNGLPVPITVQLDDGQRVEVPPQQFAKAQLAEGKHTAQVVEPAGFEKSANFAIEPGIFQRWFERPVYFVDPTRSAILIWEATIYTEFPADEDQEFRLFVGQPATTVDKVDYLFEEFPEEIQVKSLNGGVRKTRAGLLPTDPGTVIYAAPNLKDDSTVLDFLEAHLRYAFESPGLLMQYTGIAHRQQQLGRCVNFLRQNLDKRPIDVEWHRSYQATAQFADPTLDLKAEYDRLLAADPENANLLYLRGRLEHHSADASRFYDRVPHNAPVYGYVLSAEAYHLRSAGEFAEALQTIERAIQTQPERTDILPVRQTLLIANGQSDKLERELRRKLAETPQAYGELATLVSLLASRGKSREATQLLVNFDRLLQREAPGDPNQLVLRLKLAQSYQAADFATARELAAQLADRESQDGYLFWVELEANELAAAGEILERVSQPYRAYDELSLSLAWNLLGNEAETKKWRERAIQGLSVMTGEHREIAEALQMEELDESTAMQIMDLAAEPSHKSIALIVLADRAGSHRADFLNLAEKLNFDMSEGQRFYKRAIVKAREANP